MYRLRGMGSYLKELGIFLRAEFALRVRGVNSFGSQWDSMQRYMDAPAGTTAVEAYESRVSTDLLRMVYVSNGELYTVDKLEHVSMEDVGRLWFSCPCHAGQNGSFIEVEMRKPPEVPCTD